MNVIHSTLYQALELKYHLRTMYPRIEETGLDLLVSALTEYNQEMPTDEFFKWLDRHSRNTVCNINNVPLKKIIFLVF